ncbi:MAG: hypothetical protein CHACPFDD_01107 [Phycisphaerae bacterium]|nr:hypothetical protein [Phycisphaerae bacterium]
MLLLCWCADEPQALKALVATREALETGEIQWVIASRGIPAAARDEQLAELEKLKRRMQEIEGPINHIEHRELRPRLDKLPTRAQRRAAEGK